MSPSRTRRRLPSFGIFAEGSKPTDPDRGRFEELWRHLFQACGGTGEVHVYGFSKKNIILLKEPPNRPRLGWSDEPLDLLIKRSHEQNHFDNAIVAFDRWPANQEITTQSWCLRTEVNWVLESFLKRQVLPPDFLRDSQALLERYAQYQYPERPRGSGRPPLCSLEFIFMDPTFEGLLVEDESAVLRALELAHRPRRGWPKFNSDHREPGLSVLQPAIDCAAGHHKRGFPSFKVDKHGWALRIIQQAPPDSRLWIHPISSRLSTLVRLQAGR